MDQVEAEKNLGASSEHRETVQGWQPTGGHRLIERWLLIRHLVIPAIVVESVTGWHPVWVWVYLPISVAWAVVLYKQALNPGWLVIYGGGLLNKICVIANGGYMPVGGGLITATQGKHTPLRPDHVLVGFADIHGGASLGDFVIAAGLLTALAIWAYRKGLSCASPDPPEVKD